MVKEVGYPHEVKAAQRGLQFIHHLYVVGLEGTQNAVAVGSYRMYAPKKDVGYFAVGKFLAEEVEHSFTIKK